MQHVRFGRTGLKVSRLCLGTMTFGYQCDDDTSFAIMDAAAEAGITFFDTADVYPLGGTARACSGAPRRSIGQLVGVPTRPSSSSPPSATSRPVRSHGMPATRGRTSCAPSRHRCAGCGTDYVDLYQLHSWDADTPIDETLQALDDVVRAGKVRYIGCSNFLAYQLARSVGRAEVLGTSELRQRAAPLQPAVPRERARAVPAVRRGGHRRHPLQPTRRGLSQRQAPTRLTDRGRSVHAGWCSRSLPGALLARPHVRDGRRAAADRRRRRRVDGDDGRCNGCWPTR